MTPDEQRIAIAEACGWVAHSWVGYKGRKCQGWLNTKTNLRSLHLPDYLTDLNAMHEAEKVLTPEQRDTYCDHLGGSLSACAFATAAQRAEAFCRTLFPERFKS
jgi:hypothetical protein